MSESFRKDEYKKVKIPFGFDKQLKKTFLSLFHTFFVAMTGHGKTLGMKSLLLRFHELFPEWKILIIDSKDKRDYADLNSDIPICFVETTEPLDLKNLLEPIVGAKMMYYFDKIIEEAIFDTLGEIQENIEKKITQADQGKLKIHGKELGKLRVLNHLLKKLVQLVERPEITSELKLQDGFNVMSVSLPEVPTNLKRAFQQLIVRSVIMKLMLIQYEKVLLVLDESHKWSPQRYSSIVKQPLSELVSEGRSKDVLVWMADQALTKVDKEPLKNVKIWVVGQQLQEHEVEDAITAVSDIADLTVDKRHIKNLRIGNWIIVDGMHRTVEHVYLQPYKVPDDVAVKIVNGANPEIAEPYILEFESKLRKSMEVDEDLVYKELCEKIKKERDQVNEDLEQLRKDFEERVKEEREKACKEAMDKFEEMKKNLNVEELRQTIATLKDEKVDLEKELEFAEKHAKEVEELLEPLQDFKEAFIKVFGGVMAPTTSTPVSTMPGISVAEVDERINQRLRSGPSPIPVVSVDVDQRIKELVKNEVINRIVTKIQALPEPAKKAAWWLHEKKQANIRALYNYMFDRPPEETGRIPGTFYMNVVNPLQDAWLIVNEAGNIHWSLQEKLQAELKEVFTNSDLEKVPKYLASLLL